MRVRCKTCNGEYETEQKDTKYFHACPMERIGNTDRFRERPNKRDENLFFEETIQEFNKRTFKDKTGNMKSRIRSKGRGVEQI